jgi:hypothetical protein
MDFVAKRDIAADLAVRAIAESMVRSVRLEPEWVMNAR